MMETRIPSPAFTVPGAMDALLALSKSATKAGVQAFAETLRKEVATRNIRVTVIQPGSVATDMQECSEEEKRAAVARDEMLHAEEIAEAIVFALTRSARADVVTLRIEPRIQKTA